MAAQLQVHCTHCGQPHLAEREHLGQEAVCIQCSQTFTLWPDEQPAPTPSAIWYLKVGAEEMGPFTVDQMKGFASQGRIKPDTLIRKSDEGPWHPASVVRGLLAAPAPPPLPKPSSPTPATPVTAGRSTRPSAHRRVGAVQRARPAARSGDLAADLARHPGAVLGILAVIVGLVIAVIVMTGEDDPPRKPETPVAKAPDPTPDPGPTSTGVEPAPQPEPVKKDEPLTTEQIVDTAAASVAFIQGYKGSGSGFLIDENVIVTNRHVIDGELISQVRVQFPDASVDFRGTYGVSLIYEDPDLDLAFLEIEIDIPPLAVAKDYKFRRGQAVTAIGSPGIGNQTVKNAITTGVLSTEMMIDGNDYYQLGMAVNSGNSGGPVFDDRGRVIGVVTLKAEAQESLAFCIPADLVDRSLLRSRKITSTERRTLQSRHRLVVIAETLQMAGLVYQEGMHVYVMAMQVSLENKVDVNEGLALAREAVADVLSAINIRLMHDVRNAVPKVMEDPNLDQGARDRVNELYENYLEFKSYVDNPRGTFETYKAKQAELTLARAEIVNTMRAKDGIEAVTRE